MNQTREEIEELESLVSLIQNPDKTFRNEFLKVKKRKPLLLQNLLQASVKETLMEKRSLELKIKISIA